jgi:hypothetical protein
MFFCCGPLAATLAPAAEPVDPDLIPEARRVLDYLESVQGKKILTGISGCQDSQPRARLREWICRVRLKRKRRGGSEP